MTHEATDLEAVFNDCFVDSPWACELQGGFDEPLYIPGKPLNSLRYREDFFASALHEIAHWCIAGVDRLRVVDFGYWYEPDGRDAQTQARFEAVESHNQGLEWLLCDACGFPFKPSFDNLSGGVHDEAAFFKAVTMSRDRWINRGLPRRAEILADACALAFRGAP